MWANRIHRLVYRLAFPLVDRWWRFRQNHQGVVMAVWLDDRVLAVRHSYKPGWRLPGGGMRRGEDYLITMVRELQEELGLTIDPTHLRLVRAFNSIYGREHLCEVRIAMMPELIIDQREIIEAQFLPPDKVDVPDSYIGAYLRNRSAMVGVT